MGHMEPVVRYAYMTDLSAFLCLQDCLIEARPVSRKGAERRIVELVDVHIVRLEHLQCGLQVFAQLVACQSSGFRGYEVTVSGNALEGYADLLLAVGISAGGVEECDAGLQCFTKEPDGIFS